MTRADLEAAAAEKYPERPEDGPMVSALVGAERAAYIHGRLDTLPEVPDDAVIEAMAKAIDHLALEIWVYDWPSGVARAAYAALRGAMQ